MALETPRFLLISHRSASRCPPESPQRPHIGRIAELLEGPFPDLPDTFPGDTEQRADLFQRQRFGALLETVVERKDFALARSQMTLENTVDEFALQPDVGHLLDLDSAGARHPLAECAGTPVLPFN